MLVKSNVRRLVCARPAARSSSPSANTLLRNPVPEPLRAASLRIPGREKTHLRVRFFYPRRAAGRIPDKASWSFRGTDIISTQFYKRFPRDPPRAGFRRTQNIGLASRPETAVRRIQELREIWLRKKLLRRILRAKFRISPRCPTRSSSAMPLWML